MRKFKFNLKLLPSLLGWLFLIFSIAFILSMALVKPAHAEGLTCKQHKNFFGLQDGWDCKAGAGTDTLVIHSKPAAAWCSQGGDECKATGRAKVEIDGDALAELSRAQSFELAMRCTTKPGGAAANCEWAEKAESK
jgi:hypothetical protein